ncbi:hypothetical protein ABG751_00255 [Streptococcus iniae]
MELKELFPGVTCGAFPLSDDAFVSIEEDGRFFHFPKDSLSERELSLLSLKTGQKLKNSTSFNSLGRLFIKRNWEIA